MITEVDNQEAEKVAREREQLLNQVSIPSTDVILRYPIEVWVSSGGEFFPPEKVETKVENRKKKRAFRSAVSLELDIERHVLRQMKGLYFQASVLILILIILMILQLIIAILISLNVVYTD